MPATTEYPHHGHGGSLLRRLSIKIRSQVNVIISTQHEDHQPDPAEHLDLRDQIKNALPGYSNISPSIIDHNTSSSLLSIACIRKLLDSFLSCEAEFKALLIIASTHDNNNNYLFHHRHALHDLLDRSVQALDVCHAVSHGVESIRGLHKLTHILVLALEHRPLGEGQISRAKKALRSLRDAIRSDEEETIVAVPKLRQKTWSSFNYRSSANAGDATAGTAVVSPPRVKERSIGGGVTSRKVSSSSSSSSCGVSKNLSVTKQIHAMTSTLVVPPRCNNESSSSPGLAWPIYAMSCMTVFVMWVLAAAIPCQDRKGLASYLPAPKHSGWAPALLVLQDRISEEWKKGSPCGLMEEIQKMDTISIKLIEFTDSLRFPLGIDDEIVNELREICERMARGLAPLQLQIRQVFCRIVTSRAEILKLLDRAATSVAPTL